MLPFSDKDVRERERVLGKGRDGLSDRDICGDKSVPLVLQTSLKTLKTMQVSSTLLNGFILYAFCLWYCFSTLVNKRVRRVKNWSVFLLCIMMRRYCS